MSEPKPIRVMIVDDHDVVRRGLTVFLKAFDDLELVGQASNGEDAVQLCAELKPDVILMDIMMSNMNGITTTKIIRQMYPHIQIIALTSFKDHETVRSALQAGAIGYLLKDAPIDDLAESIRTAYLGKHILGPEATQALITAAAQAPSISYELTERELNVLTLMVKGLSNPQIANHLMISRSTVKFHVSIIFSKLGVSSRTEAVALAIHHKLI